MQFIALSLGQLSAFPSNGLMHTRCPLVDVSSAWFKALKSLAAPMPSAIASPLRLTENAA